MAYENVILVVILMGTVFFGAKKLPELARSLGRAQTEFEKARIEAQREIRSYNNEDDNTNAAAGQSPGAPENKGAGMEADNVTAATTKVSESNNNSSLVVTAAAADIDRVKLQNAAKKIGVENPEKLSDDELRDAIRNNLDL
ncbi:MAG TPA: twin-arginine translocase TatA/TatE family subunit [Nitrososphaera sp.]